MMFASCSRRLLTGIAAILGGVVIVLAAWAWSLPRIAVEVASQDLGEKPQQHLELKYKVRNEGNSVPRIEEVTTTCSCTKASVERGYRAARSIDRVACDDGPATGQPTRESVARDYDPQQRPGDTAGSSGFPGANPQAGWIMLTRPWIDDVFTK